MKYSVDIYLRSRRKWERINILLGDISDIERERKATCTEIEQMASRLLKNLSGKTIYTLIAIEGNRKEFIVFGKRGFGVVSDFYSRHYRQHGRGYNFQTMRVIDFLAKNKSEHKKVLSMIKKKDKKEILECFVRNSKNEKKDELIFNLPKGKTIKIPDSENAHTLEISSIVLRDRELFAVTENKDSISLEENDISTNMIKEQLYLPCWKLLIKAKRHALKSKRETEKRLAKIKKEVEPYWFAEKLADAAGGKA